MQGASLKVSNRFRSFIFSLSSLSHFHSTPGSFAKWKDNGTPQQPSKLQFRYSVRYKRSDAKTALKDLLLNGKASGHYFQKDEAYDRHSKNSGRSKPQKASSGKGKQGKRWQKKNRFSDEDEQEKPEMVFTANFEGNQSFTWNFNTWKSHNFQNPTAGFEWKEESQSNKNRARVWNESDIDEEEEEVDDMDQHSSRIALGLPASGPLCLEDVKRAFRECALRWHPDKHHGFAQVIKVGDPESISAPKGISSKSIALFFLNP